MRSTGETMGIDPVAENALAKALLSAGLVVPQSGAILLSIADRDKKDAVDFIQEVGQRGLRIFATPGTATVVRGMGLPVEILAKIEQGHPNAVDLITAGMVDCVVNTPGGPLERAMRDGFEIRRAASDGGIPCFTSIQTAEVALRASGRDRRLFSVQPLTEYRRYCGALFMVPRSVREDPEHGTLLLRLAREAQEAGLRIYATPGTARFFEDHDIKVGVIAKKIDEKGPTVRNLLDNEYIQVIVNIPHQGDAKSAKDDGIIKTLALQNHVPVYSSLERARGYIRKAKELSLEKGILLTVAPDRRDEHLLRLGRLVARSLGWPIYATQGTGDFLRHRGTADVIVVTDKLGKLGLTVGTVIQRNQVRMVLNVVNAGDPRSMQHDEKMRSLARKQGIPVFASVEEAIAHIQPVVKIAR